MTDGAFDHAKWRDEMGRIAAEHGHALIPGYAHYIIDEPHVGRWNGGVTAPKAVRPSDIIALLDAHRHVGNEMRLEVVKRRSFWRRIARLYVPWLALAAFLLLALAGVARAQMAPASVPPTLLPPSSQTISYEQLTGYIGITICVNNRAYTFIRDGLSDVELADTRAHEAKHREQYARFKDCGAVNRWYVTPKGTVEAESEAFMAGLCVAVSMGADRQTLMQDYAGRIERLLGGEVNRLQIIQEMQKYKDCP